MNIIRQDQQMMRLQSDVLDKDLAFINTIGIASPVIGAFILLTRQDLIALLLAVSCFLGISLLFTEGVPESATLNKSTKTIYFTRKGLFKRTTYTYPLDEISIVEVMQNGGSYFVRILLSSGKKIQCSRSPNEVTARSLQQEIHRFLADKDDEPRSQ